jgi:cytochrome c oxidase subunit 1
MPRRYYNYVPEFESFHKVSTIGSYIMGLGFLIIVGYLMHSLFRGRKAPANPWGGATLEWRCASPPPHHNFDEAPIVDDPYDFTDVEYEPETDEYVRRRPAGPGDVAPAASG